MANRTLSQADVERLYRGSSRTREWLRDRALICLCVDAGARRREIPGLRVGDVDRMRWTVTLGAGPSARTVRLGLATARALQPFMTRCATEPLLVSRSGRPITPRVVQEQLRRIGELSGVREWVTTRQLRRVFVAVVTGWHDVGVALRLAGHLGSRVAPSSVLEAAAAQQHLQRSVLDHLLEQSRAKVSELPELAIQSLPRPYDGERAGPRQDQIATGPRQPGGRASGASAARRSS